MYTLLIQFKSSFRSQAPDAFQKLNYLSLLILFNEFKTLNSALMNEFIDLFKYTLSYPMYVRELIS